MARLFPKPGRGTNTAVGCKLCYPPPLKGDKIQRGADDETGEESKSIWEDLRSSPTGRSVGGENVVATSCSRPALTLVAHPMSENEKRKSRGRRRSTMEKVSQEKIG